MVSSSASSLLAILLQAMKFLIIKSVVGCILLPNKVYLCALLCTVSLSKHLCVCCVQGTVCGWKVTQTCIMWDTAVKKVTIALAQWFSTKGGFVPLGDIGLCLEIFFVVMMGGVGSCHWHLGSRDWRCCKHLTIHRTALPPPAPPCLHKTDSSVVEEPCTRGHRPWAVTN